MIRKHTRRAAKAAFAISFGVAIILGLFTGTARPAAQQAAPTIVMGTKNFPEEYILGELYKQALEAKGFNVSFKGGLGSTELIHTALTSGKINFYPEYTGTIVDGRAHHKSSPKTAAATYALAKQLEAKNGLTLLAHDAVLRHGRDRRDQRDGEEVRPEDRRRPEEGGQLQVRRLPRVQDARRSASSGSRRPTASRTRRSSRSPGSRPTPRSTPARCWRPTSSRPTRRSARPRSTRCSPTRSTSAASRTSRRS